MLTLIYDAFEGTPFRDGEVPSYVDVIVTSTNNAEAVRVNFATENILFGIRCALKGNRIQAHDVLLYWRKEDESLESFRINQRGQVDHWPDGFCDTNDKFNARLIDW